MLIAACLCMLAAVPLSAQTAPVPAKGSRGEPIRSLPAATSVPTETARTTDARLAALPRTDENESEFIRLGFDKLAAFDYDLFKVYSEINAGRPLLKPTNSIPPKLKAYDGRPVTVRGIELPLPTRSRLVRQFLLLCNQGTYCFGARAQPNPFVPVRSKAGGFSSCLPIPCKAALVSLHL